MKGITYLFSVLIAIIVLASLTQACSCVPPKSVQEEFASHDSVFHGKVIDIKEKAGNEQINVIKFEVKQGWKNASGKEITIETYSSSAGCGYNFEIGKEYVVYAQYLEGDELFSSKGSLLTSLCSRTSLASDASEDISILNKINLNSSNTSNQNVTESDFTKDAYILHNISLEGNKLLLNISYSGGCAEHYFELKASPGLSKSLPPQKAVYLYHDSKGDMCEALIQKTLSFDVDEIVDLSYEEIVINFHDSEGETHQLTYKASSNSDNLSFFQKITSWFKSLFSRD